MSLMLRLSMLLVVLSMAGCAEPVKCYRIASADTWVSGGPGGYSSHSRDFYGYTSDKTRGDAWNVDVGISTHWSPSACAWEYYEEEAPAPPAPEESGSTISPVPGGSGSPVRR